MSLFKTILNYAGFGKKGNMAESDGEFQPTDILNHRYQDPQVLISYVKTLPGNFTDDQIRVQVLGDNRLGLKLPRKLTKEETQGALQAFIKADRLRRNNDDD